MPNRLDENGLQLKTRQELLNDLETAFRTIYGPDVNLEPDTQDGQIINIFIQSYQDLQDLLVSVFNSFDPDNAIGRVLDARVALNGVQRQAGTKTITDITIVTNKSLTLHGLDQTDQEVYTIQDNEGNRFQLIRTQNIAQSGSYVAQFQAENNGRVLTLPNTITTPFTIVLGVESINNPSTYSVLGINEEDDFTLRERRKRSVSLSAQGYLDAMRASLRNINGVTNALVLENDTRATDANGTPPNSVWVIVSGTASDVDIANTIYRKRTGGLGSRGDITYPVVQNDGTTFVVRWDTVTSENIFVFANVRSIDGMNQPRIEEIREELAENLFSGVNEDANQNYISDEIQKIDSNALITSVLLSNGKEQKISLSAVPNRGVITIKYNENVSQILNWDDSAEMIQTTIRAIPGLENVVVTGTFIEREVTIDFNDHYDTVPHLILFHNGSFNNTASIFTFSATGNALINPSSRKFQFVYNEANIVLYDMVINPEQLSLPVSDTGVTLEAFGGYGEIRLSFHQPSDAQGVATLISGVFTALSPGTVVIEMIDERSVRSTATIRVF